MTPQPTSPQPTSPRTAAGRALGDYLRGSFVYEADDTERIDVTDRILAIEAEAAAEGALRQLERHLHEESEADALLRRWTASFNAGYPASHIQGVDVDLDTRAYLALVGSQTPDALDAK